MNSNSISKSPEKISMYSNLPTSPKGKKPIAHFGNKKQSASGGKGGSGEKKGVSFKSRNTG